MADRMFYYEYNDLHYFDEEDIRDGFDGDLANNETVVLDVYEKVGTVTLRRKDSLDFDYHLTPKKSTKKKAVKKK